MARGKKHSPEQIVSLLRQIEVAVANGKTTGLACKRGFDHGANVLPLAERVWRAASGPGPRLGKLLSPERRRCAVGRACGHGMSERRACRLVKQPRGTQRYRPTQRDDEKLTR